MGREYPDYRPNIELIGGIFPGKVMLDVADVETAFGISVRTVYRRYGAYIRNGQIPVTTLARLISEPKKGWRK